MPVGPRVDDVEHDVFRLGRHEAEQLLQDRVDDGVQPTGGEGLVVVLGLPDVDVAQPVLDLQREVRDEAGVTEVGAGDAFTAGLVRHYLRKSPLAKMNDAANRLGAWVASQKGAMPTPGKRQLKKVHAAIA